jgi:beta-galactosidase
MENKLINGHTLSLGTCYYPEHWPEKMWEEDLKRMLDTGIRTIRIAEFAWSKVEPMEGKFTYDFFDRFLDLCDRAGMQVIMGTPTATPPAWLTQRYPEVLNCDINGLPYRHGMRRHYNYNSSVYREKTAIIVEKFAARYAQRACVIGWQIDNELNCETGEFYSEADSIAFRKWCEERYGTLDALNEAWGTVFWNETYTDWNEVYVPRRTIHEDSTNPHQKLDYYRFISDSCLSYAKLQADIIRRFAKPGDFVTTNGLFGHIDYQKMRDESLDFITYDSYPAFAYSLDQPAGKPSFLRDRGASRNLSEARAISQNFGIMEQQSGPGGWYSRMKMPAGRPGQITLWTMQSVAHGADYVGYFRWRTATIGNEIYWHGILDYSGRDNRRLREIRDIHEKFEKMQGIAGTCYAAKTAYVKDYDNVYDSELDKWMNPIEWQSQMAIFEAAQRTHTPLDFVYLTPQSTVQDLLKYDVLFYAHPEIMTKERAELLEAYTAAGGKVVFGCRSAYKDIHGHCVTEKLPGLLRNLTGADVPEFSNIADDAGRVCVRWGDDEFDAAVFTDEVEAADTDASDAEVFTDEAEAADADASDAAASPARVVGRYHTTEFFDGEGALTEHSFGKGVAYYYGSAFTVESAKVFLRNLGAAAPYEGILRLPETCELAVRERVLGKAEKAGTDTYKKEQYFFVLNYRKEPAKITLEERMTNVYTGQQVQGEIDLEGYGTLVLRRNR